MMVRPGDNKFKDKSHWGTLYLGENKYTGMIRFSQVLRSAHFPKIFGVYVRNTSKILTFLFGSFERPLSCVREFKSSLLMSLAVNNLAFRRDIKNAFAGIN